MNESMCKLLSDYKYKSKIAKNFGISDGAVAAWYKKGYVPIVSAMLIEQKSKGIYKAEDLSYSASVDVVMDYKKSNTKMTGRVMDEEKLLNCNKEMIKLYKEFGSKYDSIGCLVSVTKQTVSIWYKNGYVPSKAAKVIEKVTNGRYNAFKLTERKSDPVEDMEKLKKRGVSKVD